MLTAAAASDARAAVWRRGEAAGGQVTALARDPASDRLYAAGAGGAVFASDNGGASWRRVDERPIDDDGLLDIEVAADGVLVAVQRSPRAYLRSTDGGATWSEVTLERGSVDLPELLRDPTEPARLYSPGGSFGVLISEDSGATWRSVDEGLVGFGGVQASIVALAQSPARPRFLYAVSTIGDFYRSTDRGESWTRLSGAPAHHLAAHPTDAGTVFAWGRGHLLRSTDAGESWQLLDPGVEDSAYDVLGFTPGGAVLLGLVDGVGFLRSADGGDSFQPVPLEVNPVAATAFLTAGAPGRVLAATRGGVLASDDDGRTWAPANAGLGAVEAEELVVAGGAGLAFMVHQGGLARSEDRGATWQRTAELGLPGNPPLALAASRQDGSTLYSAIFQEGRTRAAASTDAGRAWTLQPPLVHAFDLNALAIDRLDDRRLVGGFVGSPIFAGQGFPQAAGGFFASADGGESWEQILVPDGDSIFFFIPTSIAVSGDTIVAAANVPLPGGDAGVVFRSSDGGTTWAEQILAHGFVLPQVAMDAVDPQLLYLRYSDQGVHRSLDGGETWAPVDGLPGGVYRDLATSPTRGGEVLAVRFDGVYRSTDRGDTWELLPPAPAGERFDQAASAPDGTVHAATAAGLYTLVPDEIACQGPHRLCLNGDRFLVEVAWKDFQGGSGAGVGRALTGDTGAFWFFDPANVELVVKVLDARAVNGRFWVFYGSLTNVEFRLRVTDRVTGDVADYFNPPGQFASRGDTDAFAGAGAAAGPAVGQGGGAPSLAVAAALSASPAAASAACDPGPTALCLADGRFRAEVEWQDRQGGAGAGRAVPVADSGDTGTFWFFDPANVELVVKVLDARAVNGHFWVFYGALTNVGYTLTVTDTETGEQAVYVNPAGTFGSHGDTAAFPR